MQLKNKSDYMKKFYGVIVTEIYTCVGKSQFNCVNLKKENLKTKEI